MISIERSVYERYPRLAEGAARSFAQPVIELLRRVTCEDAINGTLRALAGNSGFDFVDGLLQHLQVSYSVANTDRENIPVDGGVVIVANHPLGGLDAIALLHLVGSVRRDVRIIANEVLMQLEPLRPLLLPVNVFGADGQSHARMREAYRALEAGEALIVFPAGEVSRMRPNGVRDTRWSGGFVRMARKCGVPVLPVHIAAHNSPMFYGVSMLAKPLATLLLARELFGARRTRIGFNVGAAVPATALDEDAPPERLAKAMRRHIYRLATRRRPAMFTTSIAIAHPEPPLAVKRALRRGEVLGSTTDGKRIILLDAAPDCAALREIGRLREVTFRRVGEGTGTRRDLDRFDPHYRHLVLWDEDSLSIVGAYRLGEAGAIIRKHGMDGLYSASLFDFVPEARDFLDNAVELGRSFVQPAFWGSRSLDYLWQGIGAYLRHRPEVRWLFGPVSLSAALPSPSRDWIVHCHQHYFGDPEHLAKSRNPFKVDPAVADVAATLWSERSWSDGFAELKKRLGALGTSLPMLYRQYVDLCEPEGVRFLAFGTDPAFGGCVDGLVRLDLSKLKPAKRSRYIGD